MTRHRRRAQRRAESRLFEAIEAADAGQLRLAEELLHHAVTPRRARATIIATELASLQRGADTAICAATTLPDRT